MPLFLKCYFFQFLGEISLPQIMQFHYDIGTFTFSRVDTENNLSCGNFVDTFDNGRLFLISSRCDIYEDSKNKRFYSQPLRFLATLTSVKGSTSQHNIKAYYPSVPVSPGNAFTPESTSFRQAIPGKLLFQYYSTSIRVKPESVQTLPMPDSMIQVFKRLPSEAPKVIERITHSKRPSNVAHTYHCKASWSDIDLNGHATTSAFCRYAIDGATDAVYKSKLQCCQGDLAKQFVVSMEMTYLKEINANDNIIVYVWEEKGTFEDQNKRPDIGPQDHICCELEVKGKCVYKITLFIKKKTESKL